MTPAQRSIHSRVWPVLLVLLLGALVAITAMRPAPTPADQSAPTRATGARP